MFGCEQLELERKMRSGQAKMKQSGNSSNEKRMKVSQKPMGKTLHNNETHTQK